MKVLISIIIILALPGTIRCQSSGIYIVIDGKRATQEELQIAQEDPGIRIHYILPAKAAELYGPQAHEGALIVNTRNVSLKDPIFVKNGQIVPKDSIRGEGLKKIDVLRGRDAINAYGPAGHNGVFVASYEKPMSADVQVHVSGKNDKPLKGVQIISDVGTIIGVTDRCGNAYLQNFSAGQSVKLKYREYPAQEVPVNDILTIYKLDLNK